MIEYYFEVFEEGFCITKKTLDLEALLRETPCILLTEEITDSRLSKQNTSSEKRKKLGKCESEM